MQSTSRIAARDRAARVVTCLLLVPAVLVLGVREVRAQDADAGASGENASPGPSRVAGSYRTSDGRLLVVWDLVDQMPGGAHQLAVFEPESGWLRTLHHEAGRRYGYGPGWFAPAPRRGSLSFDTAAGTAIWIREGGTVSAARTRLRRREIRVEGGDVPLAGELILPPEEVGAPPYPGLLMVPGFGPLTRRTPRIVADQFALAGIAVLVHDRRGTGGSGGTYTPGAVPAFARDARAALTFLRGRPEVDADRVGVMASSLGGLVAPLLFEHDPDWAFFVCRVCPSTPAWEQKVVSILARGRAAGLAEGELLDALSHKILSARYAVTRDDYAALRAVDRSTRGEAWRERVGGPEDWREVSPPDAGAWDVYREVLAVDPGRVLRELHAPVLLILGELDDRLPGDYHAMRARRISERAGREDRDVWVLPNASHGLMEVERDEDGARRPFRRFVPGWHGRMVRWVADRVGLP